MTPERGMSGSDAMTLAQEIHDKECCLRFSGSHRMEQVIAAAILKAYQDGVSAGRLECVFTRRTSVAIEQSDRAARLECAEIADRLKLNCNHDGQRACDLCWACMQIKDEILATLKENKC